MGAVTRIDFPQISETPELFNYFFDREIWISSIKETEDFIKPLTKYTGISNKVKSELISGIVPQKLCGIMNEKYQSEDYLFRIASNDNEPDMIVEKKSFLNDWEGVAEIKVAKATTDKTGKSNVQWRGGEFSKRDGDYFLISYDFDPLYGMKWFICYCHVRKEDWESSIDNGYYATTISAEKIITQHLDKNNIIIGDTSMSKKNKQRLLLGVIS